MSSYGSSVKAIRKASTHLTEESFYAMILGLYRRKLCDNNTKIAPM